MWHSEFEESWRLLHPSWLFWSLHSFTLVCAKVFHLSIWGQKWVHTLQTPISIFLSIFPLRKIRQFLIKDLSYHTILLKCSCKFIQYLKKTRNRLVQREYIYIHKIIRIEQQLLNLLQILWAVYSDLTSYGL